MNAISRPMTGQVWQIVVLVLVAAAAIAAPVVGLDNYTIIQISLMFIWASLAVQWNLVFGIAGIMTLGQVAAFAFGAYVTAMCGLYLEMPFPLAVLMAIPATVLFNLLLGFITLRMRGEYVSVVTFAIAMLMAALVEADVGCYRKIDGVCYPFTGGMRGLASFGDFGWSKTLGFSYRYWGDYYLTFALLILSLVIASIIAKGPFGLAFRAIRDNELYARSRGVAFHKYQLIVFAISGIVTGLAGGVYAGVVKTIGPTLLGMDLLVFILSMMVVGGRGTVLGPLIGAAVLMWADSLLQSYGAWRTGGLGLVTLLFVVFLPTGIVGTVQKLWPRFRKSPGEAKGIVATEGGIR